MQSKPQIDPLTGLRGFAAIWVALHHALGYLDNADAVPEYLRNFIEYGWTAVDLFFVLSGFVISYVHRADFPSLRSDQYLRFFKTRLARIYPAHFVALLLWIPVVIVAKLLFASPETQAATEPFSLRTFLFAVTLTNGWGFPDSTGWNGPSWSVGAEWFAYLTFPVLTVLLARLRSMWSNLAAVAVIVCVMTSIGCVVSDGRQYMLPPSATLARVSSEFAIGCCLFSIYTFSNSARYFNFMAIAASVAIVAMAAMDVSPVYVFAFILLFGMLVLSLTRGTGPVHSALASRGAVYLGRISYSIYLVHYLVLVVTRRAVDWVASNQGPYVADLLFAGLYVPGFLLAGHLLFTYVEEPMRTYLRRTWIDRRLRGAISTV